MSSPGRPENLPPLCRLCGHPAAWHPIRGSASARARLGCLECSCDLDAAAARTQTAERAEGPVPSSALIERGVLDGRLVPEPDAVPPAVRNALDGDPARRCEGCQGAAWVGLGAAAGARWLCLVCFDAELTRAERGTWRGIVSGVIEVLDPRAETRRLEREVELAALPSRLRR